MPDNLASGDPGAVWRNQPEEEHAVHLEQLANRRASQLDASTRAEIILSAGAALFFVAVMAWRIAPAPDRLQQLGFAAVIVWVILTLYRFRGRIWLRERPDALADTGLAHYRRELERRRDHLRGAWLWHGPLLLACLLLAVTLLGKTFPGLDRLRHVLPLLAVLAVWTALGIRRRRLQARELQREIDEIDRH